MNGKKQAPTDFWNRSWAQLVGKVYKGKKLLEGVTCKDM